MGDDPISRRGAESRLKHKVGVRMPLWRDAGARSQPFMNTRGVAREPARFQWFRTSKPSQAKPSQAYLIRRAGGHAELVVVLAEPASRTRACFARAVVRIDHFVLLE